MAFRALIAKTVALVLIASAPLNARSIDSVSVTEHARIPAIHPDWPVPSDPGQVFYVQRSTNSNTIVYRANFSADGLLNPKNPVSVYWRRYNDDGARKALSFFEAQFAFGVNDRRTSQPGVFAISPKALSSIKLELHQATPGRAELRMRLGGRVVRPVYAYVLIDESGFIARVVSFTVHGVDPATGRAIVETFRVSGGEILQ